MAESHKPGAHNDLEQQIISAQEKPALDEATFQQLLEAAHVIQDLKGFEVAKRPRPDPADALAVQLARLIGNAEFLHQVAAAGSDMAGNFRTSVIARRMLDDFKFLLSHADGEGTAR